jgi:uncharacterized repeat protein (TIGR01451 family)
VLTATAEFTLTTQARYDLGIYISADGGDALSGTCSVSTIPVFPDPPYVDLDGTSNDPAGIISDTCGDIDSVHSPLTHTLTSIVVQCNDEDGDGEIEVYAGLSWRQPGANGLCTSPLDAFPGAPSKCRVQQLPNLTVPVPGRIVVDKVTEPAADPLMFSFELSGGPDAVSHPFTLTDQTAPFDSADAGLVLWSGTYAVTETVPPVWELTSATCSDGSSPAAIDLAPGETVTCTFTDTLQAAPSLVLTKEISADAIGWQDHITVPVSSDIFYLFTVLNSGNVPLTGTGITDPDVSTSSCTFGDPLGAGATTTCTVGPVSAIVGQHTNTATATAIYRGVTYPSNADSASYFAAAPALAVVKRLHEPAGGVAVVSDTVTFTIRITNTGNTTLTSLTITDTHDACMRMTSADPEPFSAGRSLFLPLILRQSGGAPRSANVRTIRADMGPVYLEPVVWKLDSPLAPEAGTVITVDFHTRESSSACTNRVEVTAVDEHGYPAGPEMAEDSVRVTEPAIAVLKTLVNPDGGVAVAGDTITFTLRLTNTGDTTLTQITLVDTYDPTYLTLTSHSVGPDATAGGAITWTTALGSFLPLAPGQAVVLDIDFLAWASTMPDLTTNMVIAHAIDEYDHVAGPTQDSADVRITEPAIGVVKTLTDPATGVVEAGETVTFALRITNTGDTPIGDLVLTDRYDPAHLTLTSWGVTPDAHDAATGVVTWTDALDSYLPLAPGAALVLAVDFQADEPTAPGVTTDTATVAGLDAYGHPVGPEDDAAVVEIVPLELVSVRLSWYWYPIDPGPPDEGKIYLYSSAVQQDLRAEGALADDAQFVMILDEEQNWLETLETHSSDARRWIYSEHDLGHYAGETIWLYFGVYNDGDPYDICAFSMFVDQVSLQACYGSRPRCVEIVVNGGFEVDEAWYFPVTEYPGGYSSDLSYAGVRSMRLGIVDWSQDRESYSSGWQLVTIPEEWVP